MKTIAIVLTAGLAIAATLALAGPAAAQDIPRVLTTDEQIVQAQGPAACAPYAEFAALLASDYNETPVARGGRGVRNRARSAGPWAGVLT